MKKYVITGLLIWIPIVITIWVSLTSAPAITGETQSSTGSCAGRSFARIWTLDIFLGRSRQAEVFPVQIEAEWGQEGRVFHHFFAE